MIIVGCSGLFQKYSGVSQEYRGKFREIDAFLKDSKNDLRKRLLNGLVDARELANMSQTVRCTLLLHWV